MPLPMCSYCIFIASNRYNILELASLNIEVCRNSVSGIFMSHMVDCGAGLMTNSWALQSAMDKALVVCMVPAGIC